MLEASARHSEHVREMWSTLSAPEWPLTVSLVRWSNVAVAEVPLNDLGFWHGQDELPARGTKRGLLLQNFVGEVPR